MTLGFRFWVSHDTRTASPILIYDRRLGDYARTEAFTDNTFRGDALLSFYASATQRYRGFECLQQKDARRYQVHGAMLDQDKVISTWVLDLQLAR